MTNRGRPTKYKPEYCESVVEHMRDGKSLSSFAGKVGVARDTISEWCSEYPEFSAAVQKGKGLCADWWEERLRERAIAGEGNSTAAIFGVKNMARQDWSETQKIEHSGGVTFTFDRTYSDL